MVQIVIRHGTIQLDTSVCGAEPLQKVRSNMSNKKSEWVRGPYTYE